MQEPGLNQNISTVCHQTIWKHCSEDLGCQLDRIQTHLGPEAQVRSVREIPGRID